MERGNCCYAFDDCVVSPGMDTLGDLQWEWAYPFTCNDGLLSPVLLTDSCSNSLSLDEDNGVIIHSGEEEENDLQIHGEEVSMGVHNQRKRRASSRNLVSERKRRGRLNTSIYALRAAVPTISKMDKASTVRDAIRYIQELQRQIQHLESQISTKAFSQTAAPFSAKTHNHHSKTMGVHADVKRLGKKLFLMTMDLMKRPYALMAINKALESIHGLELKSYSILELDGHFVFTVVAKIEKSGVVEEAEELKQILEKALSKFQVF
eukprot:TRINITY_DN27610_c0_g1_i1.p1 TRINITY_DN27610_c0_g1~~TRINITY_DN27610_c0_g1_i1.p1  ORF type:complete len:278 (-),score=59.50 TRINITY_DN27610_c0_g1_i1:394-1185(-)